MLASPQEILLVQEKKRSCLWLPAERGGLGERRPCPVDVGQVVKLQPEAFKKGTAVTIIEPPVLTTLSAMDETDVRLQGYRFAAEARQAWERFYGRWAEDREAWRIRFLLGDHASFFREGQKYLISKMGGGRSYTSDPEQAIRDETAGVPRISQLANSRTARVNREAAAQRATEQALSRIHTEIKGLRPHRRSLPEQAQKDLDWLERRAKRMERGLAEDQRAAPA